MLHRDVGEAAHELVELLLVEAAIAELLVELVCAGHAAGGWWVEVPADRDPVDCHQGQGPV